MNKYCSNTLVRVCPNITRLEISSIKNSFQNLLKDLNHILLSSDWLSTHPGFDIILYQVLQEPKENSLIYICAPKKGIEIPLSINNSST